MTPEAQRIAIAEFTGRNGWWCPQCRKLVSEYSLGYQNRHANCSESARQSPDYTNDLNAMHDAEEHLNGLEWASYFERIQRTGKATGVRATAAQRAEAFLRCIGKWTE